MNHNLPMPFQLASPRLLRRRLGSVIAGAMTVEQLTANLKAIDWRLTPEEVAEVDELDRET